jgi:hypothetical protein
MQLLRDPQASIRPGLPKSEQAGGLRGTDNDQTRCAAEEKCSDYHGRFPIV